MRPDEQALHIIVEAAPKACQREECKLKLHRALKCKKDCQGLYLLGIALTHPDGRGSSFQVADAWIKAFQALAPSLDRAVLRSKALPVVMAKASASETSVASRLASCALLGALAPRLTREEVLPKFASMQHTSSVLTASIHTP